MFSEKFSGTDATRSNILLNKEKNALIRVVRHEPLVQKTGRSPGYDRQFVLLLFLSSLPILGAVSNSTS